MTTVLIVGLMLASVSLGIGTAGGVALFYFALLANFAARAPSLESGGRDVNPLLLATDISVGDHITRHLFGLTINVDTVISTVVAGLLIVAAGIYLRLRATAGEPGRLQLAFETVVSGVERQVSSTMGEGGRPIVPLAVTLFVFILLANWLELLPTGHNPQYLPAPLGTSTSPSPSPSSSSSQSTSPGSVARGCAATSVTTSAPTRCCCRSTSSRRW